MAGALLLCTAFLHFNDDDNEDWGPGGRFERIY